VIRFKVLKWIFGIKSWTLRISLLWIALSSDEYGRACIIAPSSFTRTIICYLKNKKLIITHPNMSINDNKIDVILRTQLKEY